MAEKKNTKPEKDSPGEHDAEAEAAAAKKHSEEG